MIERFIDYVVEADGKVTCDGSRRPQTAGVQGDDGACTLNFDLSAVYSDASHYFIEFVCGSGTPIILSDESDGVTFDADSKTLSVLLGKEITAEGGRVEVCVVEEVLDEESNKAVEGNTYVTYIKFDPKDGIMQRFKNTAYGIFIDFKLMIKKCSEVLNDANKTLDEVKTVKKEVEAISSIVVESLTAENTQYQDENVTGNYLTINAVFYKDGIQYTAFKQLAINIVDNFTNVITSETNYFSKYYIKAVNLIPLNNNTAYGKCELEIIEFSNTDAEIESEVDNLSLILGTFETADWGQYAEDSIKVLPDKLVENVKSAYEIAVENGFKGTEAEWLESLKGEDSAGSVKYTETQNLTEEEKNTARTNIFAMPYFEVTDDSPLEFVDITDENGNIVENAPRKLRIDMSGEITYDDKSSGMKLNKGVGLISDGNTVFVDTDAIATREYAELTAQSEVNKHNVSENSHNDIRLLVDELSSRIKALLDCDDKTLDQTSEIVAYIKANKSLIENVTTSKVNVSDIIDNLTTSVSNKPLSAKQGVMLKSLIDDIVSNYATKDDLKNIKIPDVNTFNYKKYDVPIVYINGDFDSIDEKTDIIKCDYSYENKGVTKTGYCTAKWQGSSSLNYPKKNFTIKFYNDADCTSKDKFEAKTGWGNEYKYCFKADWIDFSHSRNVVAAELWGSVVKSRKDVNTNGTISNILNQVPNGGAIDGFPIFLVINGEWQGIYNWNIPKDDWTLGMGKGVGQKEVILCASGNNSASFKQEAVIGKDFDLEYATDEKDADGNQKPETITAIQNSLNNLIRLVANSDGSNIDTEIAKHLDIQSAIDYFLFTVLTDNYDGILKNYLLGSYDYELEDGSFGKWFFGAYDLDSVFGMTINGKPTSDGKSYREYTYSRLKDVAPIHKLFKLLWDYKQEDIIARYKQLTKNAVSLASVTTKFCNYISKIPQTAYDEDAKKWTGLYNTSTNNLTQIITWYENRLDFVNTDLLGSDAGEIYEKIGEFTLTPQEVTVTSGQTEIPITLKFLDGIAVYHNDTLVESDKYTIDTDNKKLVLNGYSVSDEDTLKLQNELNVVYAKDRTVSGVLKKGRLNLVNDLKEFDLVVSFPVADSSIAIDGGAYNYNYRMFQFYTDSAISTTANTFKVSAKREKGKWNFKKVKDTTSNMNKAGYTKAIPEHDSPRLFDVNMFNKPVNNIGVSTYPESKVFPQGTTFTLYGVEE